MSKNNNCLNPSTLSQSIFLSVFLIYKKKSSKRAKNTIMACLF